MEPYSIVLADDHGGLALLDDRRPRDRVSDLEPGRVEERRQLLERLRGLPDPAGGRPLRFPP